MTRPSSIRIGAFDYSLTYKEYPVVDTRICNGLMDSESLRIELRTGMPSQREAQVLWHEVIHAIFDNAAFTPEREEEIIEVVSNGIVQVLRDNAWAGKV